jgi:hypothetical protein
VPAFKIITRHSPGGTEEKRKEFGQDSRSVGYGLNLDPSNSKQEC